MGTTEDSELRSGAYLRRLRATLRKLRRLRTSEWGCIPKTPNFGVGRNSGDSGLSSKDYGLNSEDSELRIGLNSEDFELRSRAQYRRLRAKLRRLRANLRRPRTSELAKLELRSGDFRRPELRSGAYSAGSDLRSGSKLRRLRAAFRSPGRSLNIRDLVLRLARPVGIF